MLFDVVIPSWLALLGCVATDFGLDISKYAYVVAMDDDPKAPVQVGVNSAAGPAAPARYLIAIGAGIVAIGVLLTAVGFAFVPITLLIPIFAVRFTTSTIFSWVMVGIAPSAKAKLGIVAYCIGLLLLMPFQVRYSTLLDSDHILSLYSSTAYSIFVALSLFALVSALLLSQLATNAAFPVIASVIVGSQAPVLAKQFASIMVMTFMKRSLSEAISLNAAIIICLAFASYWFWDRRLQACLSQPVEMHIAFNIMSLLNGVLLFQEYQSWSPVTVVALVFVLTGVTVLVQDGFAGEKGDATTNRRTSWKEMLRKSSARGSEIMRLGQPPALSLPVRTMSSIVFAPTPISAPRDMSVLMVADCRHQARKSLKKVAVECDDVDDDAEKQQP